MKETLWTCIARCITCHEVLNTANRVPESEKHKVSLSAPLNVFCSTKSHNTYSDMNLHFTLEWNIEEARE